MSYILKYFIYGTINLMIVAIPFMIFSKILIAIVGYENIINGVCAVFILGYLCVIKVVLQYQIDPENGYFYGWKLGLTDLKGYLALLFGK